MKQLKLIFASIAMTCLALFPAVASADDLDELEVTLEHQGRVLTDGMVGGEEGAELQTGHGPESRTHPPLELATVLS